MGTHAINSDFICVLDETLIKQDGSKLFDKGPQLIRHILIFPEVIYL